MRRQALLREVARAAKAHGVEAVLVRNKGDHEWWRVGQVGFPVPRHKSLSVGVVDSIRKRLESEFGKGWWK